MAGEDTDSVTAPASAHALPAGTRIGPYEIEAELGSGGFGITYKATDHHLRQTVAIKEYLPVALAVREGGSTVAPRSGQASREYAFGLRNFLEEARTLAQFRDPRIVRVQQFLEANGTAYLVMDYEEGRPLSRRLEDPAPIPEQEVVLWARHLLEGLAVVHRAGVLHRDVKPANVYLRDEGPPVLLDFGAARYALGEESRNLTSIVTPGYGPFEQYQSRGHQGPWTDIYSLGATLYRVVTGRRPVDAPDRIAAVTGGTPDPSPPAARAAEGRYSPALLEAIDWMLRPRPEERPQDVTELLPRFGGAPAPAATTAATPQTSAESDEDSRTVVAGSGAVPSPAALSAGHTQRIWMAGIAVGLGAALALAGFGFLATSRVPEVPSSAEAESTEPEVPDPLAAHLDGLLERGDQALADLRLTTPETDSAMYWYQQVLSLAPENERAREGIAGIVRRYVELAESAAARGDEAGAQDYLARASSVSPNDPELIAARARLASAPPAARTASLPAASGGRTFSGFGAAKRAYANREIDKATYRSVVRQLKLAQKREIVAAKQAYGRRQLTRGEYAARVEAIKRRYR